MAWIAPLTALALLGPLGSTAEAEPPPPVVIQLVTSAPFGQEVVITGQLADRQSGSPVAGYTVCMTVQLSTGETSRINCQKTAVDGALTDQILDDPADGSVVRFRWECDGDGYRAVSDWTSWYEADPNGWTQVSP